MEAEFEKVKDQKPSVQRYRRSQQDKQLKQAGDLVCDDGKSIKRFDLIEKWGCLTKSFLKLDCVLPDENIHVTDDEASAEIDPLDFVQPVDILPKLPKDFYEKLESKKWQERKEALDCLEQLLSNTPKLESAEYGDLIRAIKKVCVLERSS